MRYLFIIMMIPLLIFADSISTLFDRVEQSDLYKSRSEGKVTSAKKMVDLSGNRTQTLGVDRTYVDELDTRRYVLSLSIPLAFGSKNEAERAAAIHEFSAARHELEAFQKRYVQDTKALDFFQNYMMSSNEVRVH